MIKGPKITAFCYMLIFKSVLTRAWRKPFGQLDLRFMFLNTRDLIMSYLRVKLASW